MAKLESNDIYFLENIIPHYENNNFKNKEYDKCSVVLYNANENSETQEKNEKSLFEVIETSKNKISKFQEGHYVYYDGDTFENANGSKIAKRNIFLNNLYRGLILRKEGKKTESSPLEKKSTIYSYHINVGHGNCSILIIKESQKINIWMIDCSNFDYKNRQNYTPNIDSCIEHIKNKFGRQSLNINKFFLTHPHFDHYSGVTYLINHNFISSATEFFLNFHYPMPGPKYNELMKSINELQPTIIEPISSFVNEHIEIWHPHNRTVKSKTRKYANQIVDIILKPNNVSAVFLFSFDHKSILFPGDIETDRWDTINNCIPHLKNTNYFIISHHGSLNGHLRNNCPARMSISNLSNCLQPCSTPILIGRDGAYPGIYSSHVINDFKNIIYSEKDMNSKPCKFLEIDWQTNNFNWI